MDVTYSMDGNRVRIHRRWHPPSPPMSRPFIAVAIESISEGGIGTFRSEEHRQEHLAVYQGALEFMDKYIDEEVVHGETDG